MISLSLSLSPRIEAMQQVQNLVAVLLAAGLLYLQCPMQCEAQPSGPTGTKCPPVKGRSESCVCQIREGFMIDLSSLGNTDGTPRYMIIMS